MKILILCFLLFTINVFAGYMSKVDMFDCNKSGRTFYLKLQSCQKNHVDCVSVPQDFHCKTFSEQDTQVDNLNSPKFSKNEIETCSNQTDCETKNGIKTCIDIDEQVLMAQDYSEIYCSKPNGYNQMTVRIIRENAAMKTADDALKAIELIKRNNRNTNRGQMRALTSSLKAGTDLNTVQRRKLDLLIIRKLIDE